MNDNTNATTKPIGVDTDDGETIIMLINLMGKAFNPLRVIPGMIDAELITAAVTYAGCIHGELIEMGMMDADTATSDEQRNLLLHNYAAGVGAGRDKVQKMRTAKEGEARK